MIPADPLISASLRDCSGSTLRCCKAHAPRNAGRAVRSAFCPNFVQGCSTDQPVPKLIEIIYAAIALPKPKKYTFKQHQPQLNQINETRGHLKWVPAAHGHLPAMNYHSAMVIDQWSTINDQGLCLPSFAPSVSSFPPSPPPPPPPVQLLTAGLDAGPAAGYRAGRHRIPAPPGPLLPIHPKVFEPWQIHLDISTPWPIRLGPAWADPPGPSSAPAHPPGPTTAPADPPGPAPVAAVHALGQGAAECF